MDIFDKLLKNHILNDRSGNPSKGECLTEELIAAYLDNLLEDVQREKVANHLYTCSGCRQNSIIVSRIKSSLETELPIKAPHYITSKAMQLVNTGACKNLFEVVLNFAKDSVRVLKDTGSMFRPLEIAAAPARQGGVSEMKDVAHLSKAFPEIKIDITIEKIDDTTYEINLRMSKSMTGSPINDVRVSLLSVERELASYLTVKGHVSFKNLPPTQYGLHIIDGKIYIANILLSLEP